MAATFDDNLMTWTKNIDVEVLCHVLFSNRPLYAASKSKLFAPGIQLRCHTKEHKCHATGREVLIAVQAVKVPGGSSKSTYCPANKKSAGRRVEKRLLPCTRRKCSAYVA